MPIRGDVSQRIDVREDSERWPEKNRGDRDKGEALKPVLGALALWAARFEPKTRTDPALEAVLRS